MSILEALPCAVKRRSQGLFLPLGADFDLDQTLDCGQAFRWKQLDTGAYLGIVGKKVCNISQLDNGVLIRSDVQTFEQLWSPYFDLERDYGAVKRQFGEDPILARAITYAPGIRLLRQPAWEALCSFVISQNNNVKRIKGIVERLCALLGEELSPGLYAFPTPERLAAETPETLEPLRAGFRARYLVDAARAVCEGRVRLSELEVLPLEKARAMLMRIVGVGAKVADCVLLYGCGRLECVPMDVWVKRVCEKLYPEGLPTCVGMLGGIAQQYLFHYARTCPEAFL